MPEAPPAAKADEHAQTSTTPSRCWHASYDRLDVETVLVPRPRYEDRWHSESAGRILEDLRPATSLAHREAVFMCADPQECDDCGAHCEWLFEVKPDARVERHDLEWATRIDALVSEGRSPNEPVVVEIARRYWEGEPSEMPTWEYLTPSARILVVERY